MLKFRLSALHLALLVGLNPSSGPEAQGVVAPSTFSTVIQVQGEDPGTEFDDWAAIPIAYTDNGGAADNPGGFIDINTIQVANDNDYLYIYVDLVNPDIVAMATMYLAFDLDNDLSTGQNIFSLNAIGSELGYQTDYPFVQDAANFNTGVDGVVEFGGDFIGLGVTFPFFDDNGPPRGNGMEWAIPRSLAIGPNAPGTPVFTEETFTFIAYTDLGAGDLPNDPSTFAFESITYTFAADPNPGTPGDFDDDGEVAGDDFIVWQRLFGETLDADDLAHWQANFAPAHGLSVVPEASSVALAVVGLLASTMRRRR